MKFKVGDRVIGPHGKGTVLGYGTHGNCPGVEYDNFIGGHNAGGHENCNKGKEGHCGFFNEDEIELVEESAENSEQETPKDERKLRVEIEIDCLESEARRYKTRLTQTEARLEAYREFLEMLEQE